jgi:hypothetical protein
VPTRDPAHLIRALAYLPLDKFVIVSLNQLIGHGRKTYGCGRHGAVLEGVGFTRAVDYRAISAVDTSGNHVIGSFMCSGRMSCEGRCTVIEQQLSMEDFKD